MRIKTITPLHLAEDELARRQIRYNRLAPLGCELIMSNLPADETVPRSLGTEADCRASDEAVYQVAMQTDPTSYDAIFLDCVLDPAIEQLERDCSIPVYGIMKLCAGLLASLNHRFAAVTRNQVIGDELAACIQRHGFGNNFTGVKVLNLSFEDIADDSKWNAALANVLDELTAEGVDSLINGCSAVNVEATDHPMTVIDPTEIALHLLGLAQGYNLLK